MCCRDDHGSRRSLLAGERVLNRRPVAGSACRKTSRSGDRVTDFLAPGSGSLQQNLKQQEQTDGRSDRQPDEKPTVVRTDERTGGRTNGRRSGRTGRTDARTDSRTDERSDAPTNGPTAGRKTDGRMNGRTNRRPDERTGFCCSKFWITPTESERTRTWCMLAQWSVAQERQRERARFVARCVVEMTRNPGNRCWRANAFSIVFQCMPQDFQLWRSCHRLCCSRLWITTTESERTRTWCMLALVANSIALFVASISAARTDELSLIR